jgi:hypothetical protein
MGGHNFWLQLQHSVENTEDCESLAGQFEVVSEEQFRTVSYFAEQVGGHSDMVELVADSAHRAV